MAFTLPTFNLQASVWRAGGVGLAYATPTLMTAANLSPGRRVMLSNVGLGSPGVFAQFMELLVPKLADIRANWNGVLADLVEVPAGTKRFYAVQFVDDIGKGFTNEHRLVQLLFLALGNTTLAGGPFPVPTPLP